MTALLPPAALCFLGDGGLWLPPPLLVPPPCFLALSRSRYSCALRRASARFSALLMLGGPSSSLVVASEALRFFRDGVVLVLLAMVACLVACLVAMLAAMLAAVLRLIMNEMLRWIDRYIRTRGADVDLNLGLVWTGLGRNGLDWTPGLNSTQANEAKGRQPRCVRTGVTW